MTTSMKVGGIRDTIPGSRFMHTFMEIPTCKQVQAYTGV